MGFIVLYHQKKIWRFRAWYPVIPFFGYWAFSLLLYHVGLIERPMLKPSTYVYLFASLLSFGVGYGFMIRDTSRGYPVNDSVYDRETFGRWTTAFLILALAGGILAILDRIVSGAGSFERTLTETSVVRESTQSTTLATTISVVPGAFALVSIAYFFEFLASGMRVSWFHRLGGTAVLLSSMVISFLSVNRGQFVYVPLYIVFYIIYVKRHTFRSLMRENGLFSVRNIAIAMVAVAASYIVFIAIFRSTDEWNTIIVRRSVGADRYRLANVIPERYSAPLFELEFYATHGLTYTDEWMGYAEPLAFRPSFLLGGRLGDQIRRFVPWYVEDAVREGNSWSYASGLKGWPFEWPSLFGFLLPMFGYCGGPVFMLVLGLVFGKFSREYLLTRNRGALVLVFCLYAAMNMGFVWIGGDFSHNFGYVLGVILYKRDRALALANGARARLFGEAG